jgi:hypothetical protein
MLRGALSNTKKRELATALYISKMKGFTSDLAAVGRMISDIKMKEYILTDYDGDYNTLFTSVNTNPANTFGDACT